MSDRSCNYCLVKRWRKEATKKGTWIVIRNSNFMGGNCVFELPKGEKLPPHIIEPNEKFINGDDAYQKYSRAWMMSIGNHCEC